MEAGALSLGKSSGMKGVSNLLDDNRDRYAITPCDAPEKWVVVALSEDIMIKSISLASFEMYSSTFHEFRVLASATYPPSEEKGWTLLGTFAAEEKRKEQEFAVPGGAWARYLRLEFLSHFGAEYYCTLSEVQVFGETLVENLKTDLDGSLTAEELNQQVADIVGASLDLDDDDDQDAAVEATTDDERGDAAAEATTDDERGDAAPDNAAPDPDAADATLPESAREAPAKEIPLVAPLGPTVQPLAPRLGFTRLPHPYDAMLGDGSLADPHRHTFWSEADIREFARNGSGGQDGLAGQRAGWVTSEGLRGVRRRGADDVELAGTEPAEGVADIESFVNATADAALGEGTPFESGPMVKDAPGERPLAAKVKDFVQGATGRLVGNAAHTPDPKKEAELREASGVGTTSPAEATGRDEGSASGEDAATHSPSDADAGATKFKTPAEGTAPTLGETEGRGTRGEKEPEAGQGGTPGAAPGATPKGADDGQPAGNSAGHTAGTIAGNTADPVTGDSTGEAAGSTAGTTAGQPPPKPASKADGKPASEAGEETSFKPRAKAEVRADAAPVPYPKPEEAPVPPPATLEIPLPPAVPVPVLKPTSSSGGKTGGKAGGKAGATDASASPRLTLDGKEAGAAPLVPPSAEAVASLGSCLQALNLGKFRNLTLTRLQAAEALKAKPLDAPVTGASEYDSIFRKLMNKIKGLEVGNSILDQYLGKAHACYRDVMVDALGKMDAQKESLRAQGDILEAMQREMEDLRQEVRAKVRPPGLLEQLEEMIPIKLFTAVVLVLVVLIWSTGKRS